MEAVGVCLGRLSIPDGLETYFPDALGGVNNMAVSRRRLVLPMTPAPHGRPHSWCGCVQGTLESIIKLTVTLSACHPRGENEAVPGHILGLLQSTIS